MIINLIRRSVPADPQKVLIFSLIKHSPPHFSTPALLQFCDNKGVSSLGLWVVFHPLPPLIRKQFRIVKLLGEDPCPLCHLVALGSVQRGGHQLQVHHLVCQFWTNLLWNHMVRIGSLPSYTPSSRNRNNPPRKITKLESSAVENGESNSWFDYFGGTLL